MAYTKHSWVVGDKITSARLNNIETGIEANDTGKVAKTQTIATIDMQDNITKTELLGALNVADGSQVNIIEEVKVDGVALNIVEKSVDIDLSGKVDTALKTGSEVDYKVLSDNNYTDGEVTKLTNIEGGAQVNIIEEVAVNGVPLVPVAKSVDIVLPAYTIVESEATEGYAKSYNLTKDASIVGATINIPKDLVIESGVLSEVIEIDVPYIGAEVGDKYIDLTLNDTDETHIYIPVKDLVDTYAGDTTTVEVANHVISLSAAIQSKIAEIDNKIDAGTDLEVVAGNEVIITLTEGKTYEISVSDSYNSNDSTENHEVYGVFKFTLSSLPAEGTSYNIYSIRVINLHDSSYSYLSYTEDTGSYSLKFVGATEPVIYKIVQLD